MRSKPRPLPPKADSGAAGAEDAATAHCLDWLAAIADQRASFAIGGRPVEPAQVVVSSLAHWLTRVCPSPLTVRLRPPA